jgi:hypothetical protein
VDFLFLGEFMKRIIKLIMSFGLQILTTVGIYSTPSTQIWNPSTDVQTYKTFHFGIDNYFSIFKNSTKSYALGTDVGLTYGLIKNLEVGIDLVEPIASPVYFNVKYGVVEKDLLPAMAVGIFNVGTKKDVTDYNIIYCVIAKSLSSIGRLSVGYYNGNDKLLIDENGKKASDGIIITWDKTMTKDIWVSIDYASGKSFYGNITPGFSYTFSSNTSVIFGYVIYNNDKVNINNQFTTQLDMNF